LLPFSFGVFNQFFATVTVLLFPFFVRRYIHLEETDYVTESCTTALLLMDLVVGY